MCLICCCPSGRTCTFIAAGITGVEAVLMAVLNLIIILACSCNIKPSDSDHLKTDFMEQVWSWFIYDEENCVSKTDGDFTQPSWIQVDVVDDKFELIDSWNLVEQSSNYTYQIIDIIVNTLWASSACLLIFGNISRRFKYYFPWLILCAIVIILDTIFGSFYIRFMDDSNLGWSGGGQAVFAMQFLYFRGFVFYLYNVIAFFIVLFTCWDMYRKHRREQKVIKKATRNAKPTVTIIAPHTEEHHYNQTFYHESVQRSAGPRRPESPARFEDIEQSYQRTPAPTKYRPFSYTNPAFRPNDPHDVEGMKSNRADPYNQGYASTSNTGFDDIEQMGTKIPRINLHHKS